MNLGSLSLAENLPQIVPPPGAYLAASYHEIGHVAAYLRFGLRFTRVRIYPSDDGSEILGAVTVNGAGNREFSGLKYGIICLAGPAAEARATNTNLRDLLASNVAARDVEMATDALRNATGSPSIDVAIAAARRVVDYEWNRIDRLAIQLRRHGELDFDTCRRIVKRR